MGKPKIETNRLVLVPLNDEEIEKYNVKMSLDLFDKVYADILSLYREIQKEEPSLKETEYLVNHLEALFYRVLNDVNTSVIIK